MSFQLVDPSHSSHATHSSATAQRHPQPYDPSPSVNRYIRSRRDPPTATAISAKPQWPQCFQELEEEAGSWAQGGTLGDREIPTQAERILDAPEIVDDYYLNLLDWSSADVLAVALRNRLYLWNAAAGSVSQLTESASTITSVCWSADSQTLAVGDSSACITLYDVNAGRPMRTVFAHRDRVAALAWNGAVLSSGSRDSTIVHCDIRCESSFLRVTGHTQEVCGLRWSPDGSELASGGNDNHMCVWEATSATPRFVASHNAAVKALAWCPWKPHALATGGGTADKSIKIWNTATGACLQSVDTGSQVCALEWNKHAPELLSAHGYAQNQLTLWSWPQLRKVKELTGHTARVLFLAQNPTGATVVSAGADETLRFWNVFASSIQSTKPSGDPLSYECR